MINTNVWAEPLTKIINTFSAPYTSRSIVLSNSEQLNWKVSFTALSEHSLVEFTDLNADIILQNHLLPMTETMKYNFSFQPNADFDIVYAVTAISFDNYAFSKGNPKCVFLLTGLRASVPQNFVNNFAGAKCKLKRDNQGNLNLILNK